MLHHIKFNIVPYFYNTNIFQFIKRIWFYSCLNIYSIIPRVEIQNLVPLFPCHIALCICEWGTDAEAEDKLLAFVP